MEKQKRWHLFLILGIIGLTVYNILPTIFYYSQPLAKPVDRTEAVHISFSIKRRVNALESNALSWIDAYCKLLNIKPKAISLSPLSPEYIDVSLQSENDAARFSRYFSKAGALIPFVPAQLALADSKASSDTTVRVKRMIPIHFPETSTEPFFTFAEKFADDGSITKEYLSIYKDRTYSLLRALSGTSENAQLTQSLLKEQTGPRSGEYAYAISEKINLIEKLMSDAPSLGKRLYASFTHGNFRESNTEVVTALSATLQKHLDSTRLQKASLEAKLNDEKSSLEKEEVAQTIEQLKIKESVYSSSVAIIKKRASLLAKGEKPWSARITSEYTHESTSGTSLEGINPFFSTLILDPVAGKITIELQKDAAAILSTKTETALSKLLTQLVYNEVARVKRLTGEDFKPLTTSFAVSMETLEGSKSMLVFDLSSVAALEIEQLQKLLQSEWKPLSPELQSTLYPVVTDAEYKALPIEKQRFALVVFSPVLSENRADEGFKTGSLYVVARGIEPLLRKAEEYPDSSTSKALLSDLGRLRDILRGSGYIGYPGAMLTSTPKFENDFIFENEEYFAPLLAATRESFTALGTKKYATLDFTTVEQRLLTLNKIETAIHEDLLKWRDEYVSAQINPRLDAVYEVPKPTQSPLLSNFILSAKKYFRGDDRKILHWGLDLSGGKSVQIQLRDVNNRVVTNEAAITQGINELYRRVNKMGVSEVEIRQEGNNISLDFPGSQSLSAADLVKASSMYFHIVNEKFSPVYSDKADLISSFLQEIWNEAVVTGKKDVESINTIAWDHLYGDFKESGVKSPRSPAAKALLEAGLQLADPAVSGLSTDTDTTLSKIALYRGDSFNEWNGQTHPLVIVFNNYVLEGSSLDNIRAGYDTTKGNFLSFEVKSSRNLPSGERIAPRADLFAWTSKFSKEAVHDNGQSDLTKGNGWRMAVILNGSIISSPTLDSPLVRSAMITGSFTQREVNKLESDLKAGSLSYSPEILSENNISPELGLTDRVKGITATILALVFVIMLMVGYYRFAGVVASVAVLFNLLIMWAALQNIQATITLAGIAGIILTVGMAVDANVLVFERVREEFERSGKIAPAIRAGYAKAFSAILDSNVTTIIAALILLNFDSGPIKGFALTLIIGIASSMFTALFMTKYFFSGWIQSPKNTVLTMAQWFKKPNIPFLKYTSLFALFTAAIIGGGAVSALRSSHSLMGMDFTGGFSTQLEFVPKEGTSYRSEVEKLLKNAGIAENDMQVKELSSPNALKILLSSQLDQAGKAFAGMPLQVEAQDGVYEYETNPRIVWIVSTLQEGGLHLTETAKVALEQNWSSVSGQMSDAMRDQALLGLSIALLCIMAYIGLRFEMKYALAATLGLVVDIAFTLGAVAILAALKVPVQIDLKTIAALMTIIGYSLNDTIIIFDRIREDVKLHPGTSLRQIMHSALNLTLSRTIMTSTTTLVVLVALIALGGPTIFGLSLVMILGVAYGTLSSLFVASPLLLFFSKREKKGGHTALIEE